MIETSEGLVLIDCGAKAFSQRLMNEMTKFSDKHVNKKKQ